MTNVAETICIGPDRFSRGMKRKAAGVNAPMMAAARGKTPGALRSGTCRIMISTTWSPKNTVTAMWESVVIAAAVWNDLARSRDS